VTAQSGGATRCALITVVAAAAWLAWAHGAAEDPRVTLSTLVTGVSVFLFLPVVMATAICAVVAVPAVLLSPVAVLARITGRRSGLRSLLGELLAIGCAVPPGYVRALRNVRSPLVWGFVFGSVLAVPALWLSLAAAGAVA
jgi:hypothetical protein